MLQKMQLLVFYLKKFVLLSVCAQKFSPERLALELDALLSLFMRKFSVLHSLKVEITCRKIFPNLEFSP